MWKNCTRLELTCGCVAREGVVEDGGWGEWVKIKKGVCVCVCVVTVVVVFVVVVRWGAATPGRARLEVSFARLHGCVTFAPTSCVPSRPAST
jgi:hypothetical protein